LQYHPYAIQSFGVLADFAGPGDRQRLPAAFVPQCGNPLSLVSRPNAIAMMLSTAKHVITAVTLL